MIIKRLFKAFKHSLDGLEYALKTQFAFRLEVFLLTLFLPLSFFLGKSGVERAILIMSLSLVFVAELVNSAIEVVVDRIGLEHHDLSKAAKDLGSAAVLISCMIVLVTWAVVLIHP